MDEMRYASEIWDIIDGIDDFEKRNYPIQFIIEGIESEVGKQYVRWQIEELYGPYGTERIAKIKIDAIDEPVRVRIVQFGSNGFYTTYIYRN